MMVEITNAVCDSRERVERCANREAANTSMIAANGSQHCCSFACCPLCRKSWARQRARLMVFHWSHVDSLRVLLLVAWIWASHLPSPLCGCSCRLPFTMSVSVSLRLSFPSFRCLCVYLSFACLCCFAFAFACAACHVLESFVSRARGAFDRFYHDLLVGSSSFPLLTPKCLTIRATPKDYSACLLVFRNDLPDYPSCLFRPPPFEFLVHELVDDCAEVMSVSGWPQPFSRVSLILPCRRGSLLREFHIRGLPCLRFAFLAASTIPGPLCGTLGIEVAQPFRKLAVRRVVPLWNSGCACGTFQQYVRFFQSR